MKRLMTVLAMAVWASGASAEVVDDGNALLHACQEAVRAIDGQVANVDAFSAGQCMGLISGARDTLSILNSTLSEDLRVCFPDGGLTTGQAARVVVKYLKNNPEILNKNETLLILMAYKSAYSCK